MTRTRSLFVAATFLAAVSTTALAQLGGPVAPNTIDLSQRETPPGPPAAQPAPAPTPAPTPAAAPTAATTETGAGAAAADLPVADVPPPRAQPVRLLSIYKAILFLAVAWGWGFVVTRLDKDLQEFFLPRELWNGVQLGAAAVAFLLWLVIPYFWVGLFVALAIMAAAIAGYVFFRNPRVPDNRKWSVSTNFLTERIGRVQQSATNRAASVKLLNGDGKPLPVPKEADDLAGAAAHEALQNVLEFALPRRAERFELLADAQATQVVVQIDGVKYPQPNLEPQPGLGLITYVKQHAGLDVNDRRRKQAGRLQLDDDVSGKHTLHVTTAGSTKGLALTALIDRVGGAVIPLQSLGLLEVQRQQLAAVLDQPGRVVIAAAPPHHGLATTLFALASRHDPYTQSVIALVDAMDYDLEGVTHDKLTPELDAAAVNQKLRADLLRDAGVIMMRELADNQTAALMVQHADQARFYFGMRQDDTMNALKVWVKTVGDTKSAARALGAITAQRLVRRLCKTCRVPYQPDAEVLRKMNLTPDKVSQFYKHSGQVMVREQAETCPDCLGIGFRGRTGVFEVMALDEDARALLAAGQLDQMRSHLRKQRMLWLQEAALAKVIEGETSIGEITRVMQGK